MQRKSALSEKFWLWSACVDCAGWPRSLLFTIPVRSLLAWWVTFMNLNQETTHLCKGLLTVKLETDWVHIEGVYIGAERAGQLTFLWHKLFNLNGWWIGGRVWEWFHRDIGGCNGVWKKHFKGCKKATTNLSMLWLFNPLPHNPVYSCFWGRKPFQNIVGRGHCLILHHNFFLSYERQSYCLESIFKPLPCNLKY